MIYMFDETFQHTCPYFVLDPMFELIFADLWWSDFVDGGRMKSEVVRSFEVQCTFGHMT